MVVRIASHGPREYASVWNRTLPSAERATATQAWAAALRAEGIERIEIGIVALGHPRRAGGRARTVAVDRAEEAVSWQSIEAALSA